MLVIRLTGISAMLHSAISLLVVDAKLVERPAVEFLRSTERACAR